MMNDSRPDGPATWPAWACPAHLQTLSLSPASLTCPAGDAHPVEGGVPRFVPHGSYASAFGAQWKRYRLTQLDSHTGLSITRNRVHNTLGEKLSANLAGRHVLECGCGAGRFTETLLDAGGYVTSVDLSDAVDANALNFPPGKRHRIAQADIVHLPFAPRQFDVVFCLGVIQHTPDPERTIEKLYAQVKPGGTLVIDHYDFGWSWYTRVALPVRAALRRLPADRGLRATEWLVGVFLPIHRFFRHSRLMQTVLARISPITTYYYDIPQLSDALQREWALLDTHDSLTDWYKHFRSADRIRALLERLGASNIECAKQGALVIARATRPPE